MNADDLKKIKEMLQKKKYFYEHIEDSNIAMGILGNVTQKFPAWSRKNMPYAMQMFKGFAVALIKEIEEELEKI